MMGQPTTTKLLQVNMWCPKSRRFQSLEHMQEKCRDLCTKTVDMRVHSSLLCNSTKLETPRKWTDRLWNTQTMEHYTDRQKSHLQLYPTTELNPKNKAELKKSHTKESV